MASQLDRHTKQMPNAEQDQFPQSEMMKKANGVSGPAAVGSTGSPSSQGGIDHSSHALIETNNNIIPPNELDIPSEFDTESQIYEDVVNMYSLNNSNGFEPGNLQELDREGGDLSVVYQGEWPIDKVCWSADGDNSSITSMEGINFQDTASIMSFDSNMTNSSMVQNPSQKSEESESKPDIVHSVLSMLHSQDKVEASKMLLALSNNKEHCTALSQSGCLPLLVQLIHNIPEDTNQTFLAYQANSEVRKRASQVLRNIVYSQTDDKRGRRECRVLRLLEHVRDYCDFLKNSDVEVDDNENARCTDEHLGATVASLMKLSFDEEHRHAMCLLGGLQAIAELVQIDQEFHGCSNDKYCITIRRYSGMALTNLTFGDGTNKAHLCSMKPFMQALVAQLHSPSEELRQVSASVLRNLSWRADSDSKKMLREVGAVTTLMKAAMETSKESTLKSILSALWNLSAHCSENKADICRIDGALAFLVNSLTYKSASKNLAIIENGGGILRNISSHIAIQNDHRVILRKYNCLQVLLLHLKSSSLTVVSNACGTLWNLSARNAVDQRTLWEMGAVGMLKKLVNSKHKMISMGSSAALKNLLSAQPPGVNFGLCVRSSNYNSDMPSLHVRKQKAMSTEIDQTLSETYDNTDSPKSSPTNRSSHEKSTASIKSNLSSFRHGIPQIVNLKNRDFSDSQNNSTVSKITYPLPEEQKRSSPVHIAKNSKYVSEYTHMQNKPFGEKKNSSYVNRCFSNFEKDSQVFTGSKVPMLPGSNVEAELKVRSPSNLRPHYTSKRNDKPYISVDDTSVLKYNRPIANRTSEVRKEQSSPSPTRMLHNDEHITNLAQKIKSISLDDAECQEQPVNYSLKYSDESINVSSVPNTNSSSGKTYTESKIPLPKLNKYMDRSSTHSSQSSVCESEQLPNSQAWENLHAANIEVDDTVDTTTVHHPESIKSELVFDCYAETDLDNLDQPVDYSKKYSEQDSVEECVSSECLDDTTHFADILPEPDDEPKKLPSNTEDIMKVYCTEDTPLNFSSASSLTDLREIESTNSQSSVNFKNENKGLEDIKLHLAEAADNDECCEFNPDSSVEEKESSTKEVITPLISKKNSISSEKEAKTVTFGEEVSYAETPLMFSRSSSMGSLSSFDQQSIHDDRSSVSEFSRRTSGIVSPSDLPDSPGQTMPSSPQRRKHPVFVFPRNSAENSNNDACLQSELPGFSCNTDKSSEGVFDDIKKTFAVEGTPVQCSITSSLSSLSIDNDATQAKASLLKNFNSVRLQPELSITSFDAGKTTDGVFDDMKKTFNVEGTPVKCSTTSSLSSLSIDNDPIQTKASLLKHFTPVCSQPKLPMISHSPEKISEGVFDDIKKTFAVEGTPVQCSTTSSLSSLSIDNDPTQSKASLLKNKSATSDLSKDAVRKEITPTADKNDVSLNNSENSQEKFDAEPDSDSEENEDELLAECISSGMPNHRSSTFHSSNKPLKQPINKASSSNEATVKSLNACGASNTVYKNPKAKQFSSSDNARRILGIDGFSDDSVKVYKTEGTPNLSHSTSFSDLSVLSFGDDKSKCQQSFNNSEDHSDSSSVGDDNDGILLQCIKSGMPSSKDKITESAAVPTFKSEHKSESFQSKLPLSNSPKKTPKGPFKNAHAELPSADITKYSIKDNERLIPLATAQHCGAADYINKKEMIKTQNLVVSSGKPLKTSSDQVHSDNDCYTPKTFEVENTPVTFSRNDSLSSLSCDEDARPQHTVNTQDIGNIFPSTKIKSKISDGEQKNNNYSNKEQLIKNENFDASSNETHIVTEIKSEYKELQNTIGTRSFEEPFEGNQNNILIEGTPLCFSRSSSLSSLSVESCDEPSSTEKALLQECIREGMPKGKIDKAHNNSNIDARTSLKSSKNSSNSMFVQDSNKVITQGIPCTEAIHSQKGCNIVNLCGKEEKLSEKEEKGKEDERSQEKCQVGNKKKQNAPEVVYTNIGNRKLGLSEYEKDNSELSQQFSQNTLSGNSKSLSAQDKLTQNTPIERDILINMANKDLNQPLKLPCENEGISNFNNMHLSETRVLNSLSSRSSTNDTKNSHVKHVGLKDNSDVLGSTTLKVEDTEAAFCGNLKSQELKHVKGNEKLEAKNCEIDHVTNDDILKERTAVNCLNEGVKQTTLRCALTAKEPKSGSDSETHQQDSEHRTQSEEICLPSVNVSDNLSDVISESGDLVENSDKTSLPAEIEYEAKQIADAMLEAGVDSTDDMTVSTLSCLSDIDNIQPPSVMGELGSLSMTNSGFSDDLKVCTAIEGRKLFEKCHKNSYISAAIKKSLLKELQIGRLNSDLGSSDCLLKQSLVNSTDSLSMKSSCTSDILEDINPPSVMDDMSFTASTGSLNSFESNILDGKSDEKLVFANVLDDNSMTERLCEAAAMVQMYTKELSNITGSCLKSPDTYTVFDQVKQQTTLQALKEIAFEDNTEVACDTIGSDTELDDEFPCDDEDPGSETLQAPQLSSLTKDEQGEGSTENLTLTLTEEPPLNNNNNHKSLQAGEQSRSMSAEEFKVLQENANFIVNTLKTVHITDCVDLGGLVPNEMLEDETLSLVSNESDEDNLSPDGVSLEKDSPEAQLNKVSPDQNSNQAHFPETGQAINGDTKEKVTHQLRKSSALPQMANRRETNTGASGLLVYNQFSESKKFGYSSPVVRSGLREVKQTTRRFAPIKNFACDSTAYNSTSVSSTDSQLTNVQITTTNLDIKKDLQSPTELPITRNIAETSLPRNKLSYTNEKYNPNSGSSKFKQDDSCKFYTEENIPVAEGSKPAFDSRTFTRRKGSNSKCNSSLQQLSNNETVVSSVKALKSPTCSSRESIESCSTSNSLSSLSSNGDNVSKKSTGIKGVVASKISAVWKNSNSTRTRSKSTVEPNRSGKFVLDKAAFSSGSNSSISSKDGDRNVSRLHRPSTRISSPQHSISRSSTYEKVDHSGEESNKDIRRPTTLMLTKKIDTGRPNSSVPYKANAITSVTNVKSLANVPTVSSNKDRIRCSKSLERDAAITSPVSQINRSVVKSNLPSKIQVFSASNRKSMIPTSAKFEAESNDKTGSSENINESTRQKTCLVTMV